MWNLQWEWPDLSQISPVVVSFSSDALEPENHSLNKCTGVYLYSDLKLFLKRLPSMGYNPASKAYAPKQDLNILQRDERVNDYALNCTGKPIIGKNWEKWETIMGLELYRQGQ